MILVAGGTGRLGTLVTRRLRGRGDQVRVLTRDRARAAHLDGDDVEVVVGDVRVPACLGDAMVGVTTVVSAVQGFVGPGRVSPATVDRDGNSNLIDAAAAANAAFVLISGTGAAADSPLELFRMKYAAEQYLRGADLSFTIVRGAAFAETWIDILDQTAARSGRPVVFGRGTRPITFVSVNDVAAVTALVVADQTTRGQTLEIGGPDTITFNELADVVQQAHGRDQPPRHVPRALLRAMATFARPFKPDLARQAAAALVMDSVDLTFDPSPLREAFPGLPNTSIAEILAPGAPRLRPTA